MTTETATHTPGPWTLDYNELSEAAIGGAIIRAGGVVIGGAATEADGRIMTAAPALLAAARQLVADCWRCSDSIDCARPGHMDARAAIEQATP